MRRTFNLSCEAAQEAGYKWECCPSCHDELCGRGDQTNGPFLTTFRHEYDFDFCCRFNLRLDLTKEQPDDSRTAAARIMWRTKPWRL